MRRGVDTLFLSLIIGLTAVGFLIFLSSALGLLSRTGASYGSVVFSQLVLGVIGGGASMYLLSNIHYRLYSKYAIYIFGIGLLLTLAVFIPGLGMSHAGATRWLDLGFTTVQPSEFLKIAYVIYLATWLSGMQKHVSDWRYGLLPFLLISGFAGFVMLLQPDTDTYMIMVTAGMAMFIVAGARLRDLAAIILIGVVLVSTLAYSRPYIMDRMLTFLDPAADPLGSGYQINQSLIAVGSGGFTGRGFGQSIQKFEYLPEPIGDSIFAVYGEEFGFTGVLFLLTLFMALGLRGFMVAERAAICQSRRYCTIRHLICHGNCSQCV